MTAHFQFFMILGAAILLLIIFALLKKGQMSVKYSLLWLALDRKSTRLNSSHAR